MSHWCNKAARKATAFLKYPPDNNNKNGNPSSARSANEPRLQPCFLVPVKCWLANTKETADVIRPEKQARNGFHIEKSCGDRSRPRRRCHAGDINWEIQTND